MSIRCFLRSTNRLIASRNKMICFVVSYGCICCCRTAGVRHQLAHRSHSWWSLCPLHPILSSMRTNPPFRAAAATPVTSNRVCMYDTAYIYRLHNK